MDKNGQLCTAVNFNPVEFPDYFEAHDRSCTTYSPIPINIISSTPSKYNNDNNNNTHVLAKYNNNNKKSESLWHETMNAPRHARSNENIHLEQYHGDNNNKRRYNAHKNHTYPFYMNNSNYNKNNKHNNNIIIRNFRGNKDLKVSFEMHRRVSGLMERFKSKAKLFEIMKNPRDFRVEHTNCDLLTQAIWNLYSLRVQKKKTYLGKLELWRTLYLSLNQLFYKCSLFIVGSTMCGFSTDNSDIDMCLIIKFYTDDTRREELSYLQHIQMLLQQFDFIKSAELITAKVPILKLISSEHDFEVDLNCNNTVGIKNTHLMNCYAQLDWRVRPLVIIVKLWAQTNNINDAKNKTISSYSLVLMVIHYLQCGTLPPVLPCLHGMYPEKFNPYADIYKLDIQEELPTYYSDNKQCLGELLIGFLRYYSFLDYDNLAISVRQGAIVNKDECRYNRSPKNTVSQWKLLCIEEPFDLTNTAKSVYDIEAFEHIKYVFLMSYKLLNETKNLNSIFPCSN